MCARWRPNASCQKCFDTGNTEDEVNPSACDCEAGKRAKKWIANFYKERAEEQKKKEYRARDRQNVEDILDGD